MNPEERNILVEWTKAERMLRILSIFLVIMARLIASIFLSAMFSIAAIFPLEHIARRIMDAPNAIVFSQFGRIGLFLLFSAMIYMVFAEFGIFSDFAYRGKKLEPLLQEEKAEP